MCFFFKKSFGVLSFAIFFFIPFVSIASCCHVLLVGLQFIVLLVSSMSVFCLFPVKFLGFLCHLTIVSKRGRNLRFECHSSRGTIDLDRELHVKGKKIFDATNVGRELIWYTLILIYFVFCIFWFCNHLHTSCVISIYDNDVCVSLFISHMLFLFLLCTHVSSLYSLSIFQTWYLDSSCLVCFRKDKIKPSQDSEPSSCSNFQGSNLLD